MNSTIPTTSLPAMTPRSLTPAPETSGPIIGGTPKEATSAISAVTQAMGIPKPTGSAPLTGHRWKENFEPRKEGSAGNSSTSSTPTASLEGILARRLLDAGIVTLAEIQQLRDLDAKLASLRKHCEAHSPLGCAQRVKAAQRAYQGAPTDENRAELREALSFNADDPFALQRLSQLQEGFDRQAKHLCNEVSPLVRKVHEAAAGLISEFCGQLEKHDRSVCAAWGQPFVQSHLLVTLRGAAVQFGAVRVLSGYRVTLSGLLRELVTEDDQRNAAAVGKRHR